MLHFSCMVKREKRENKIENAVKQATRLFYILKRRIEIFLRKLRMQMTK